MVISESELQTSFFKSNCRSKFFFLAYRYRCKTSSLNKYSIFSYPVFTFITETIISMVLFIPFYHLNNFLSPGRRTRQKVLLKIQHMQSVLYKADYKYPRCHCVLPSSVSLEGRRFSHGSLT